MAAASTNYLRMFLDAMLDGAQQNALSLRDSIRKAGIGRVSATSTGMAVTSAAANGHSYTFGVPAGSALTPEGMVEICGEMLALHDSAKAALLESGIASPSDQQIFDEMNGRLAPCYNFRPDFSLPLTGAPV